MNDTTFHRRQIRPTMSPSRRARIHRVLADMPVPEGTAYIFELQDFVRCDDILDWFIRNELTGRKFLYFVREQGGPLNAGREVIRRLEGLAQVRPIFSGRDFRA